MTITLRKAAHVIAGVLLAMLVTQWTLRLGLLGAAYWRSGGAGVRAELMDASMHLARDTGIGWGMALSIQGLLVALTVLSAGVFLKTRAANGQTSSQQPRTAR
jgi:steroid 5-alpha reductase family enzyme